MDKNWEVICVVYARIYKEINRRDELVWDDCGSKVIIVCVE